MAELTKREQWLMDRRRGLGASDAAASVGLSKWKTPLELFLEKRGELEVSETEPMAWGTKLEPIVRQEFANRTGRTVEVPTSMIWHARIKWLFATVDGISDGERLYEGKTARTADGWGEPGTAEIPQEYLLQCQHGMIVTGLQVADVAVLIGGQDFRLYEIPADSDLQEMLIDQEREFWRMVQENEPPAPVSREDVKRRWRISSGERVEASVTAERLINHLAIAKQWHGALAEEIEECNKSLQEYMEDAAELTNPDGEVLATWKNIKAPPRFDLERFKSEQPELWKSYLRDAAPQRRFLLKVKGPELCPQDLLTALKLPKLELAQAE